MFNINDFLKKFIGIKPPDIFLREKTIISVKEAIGIQVDARQISITNGVIYMKCSPIIKNEIILKKEKILTHINNNEYNHTIVDIR